ncbi:DUF1348 family protein [Primorskyibacter sp. S87]|uniref:DUF1348 family protein n=1 Tax=Primorskyibacter sp. S87 TaxID=3415126 RepID=UPI003C7C9690
MSLDAATFDKMTEAYTAAWNSGNPEAVANHYAAGKGITINRGENQFGRAAMINMAGGFMASFPDLKLYRDFIRLAGDRAIFGWTLEGHHSETGNLVRASGWEEWELDENCMITNSLGWFDAVDYERQVSGNASDKG